MPSDTPLDFHRRRIASLSNMLGAWMNCSHTSCRRNGACRRSDDVFPRCLLPIVGEVNATIHACLSVFPNLPPREEPQEESLNAQIMRLNKRVAGILEAEIETLERAREKKRAG